MNVLAIVIKTYPLYLSFSLSAYAQRNGRYKFIAKGNTVMNISLHNYRLQDIFDQQACVMCFEGLLMVEIIFLGIISTGESFTHTHIRIAILPRWSPFLNY